MARLLRYFVTLYILVGGSKCVMFSNVVFMDGKYRQLRVAKLDYCVV